MEALFGFFNEIGIISQLSGNAFEKAMPEGMTLAQFSVLNHLCRLGDGWTPHRIARAMQVTKGRHDRDAEASRGQGPGGGLPRSERRPGQAGRHHRPGAGHARCLYRSDSADDAGVRAGVSGNDIAGAVPVLAAVRAWLDERRN
jgi:hypothetical protein